MTFYKICKPVCKKREAGNKGRTMLVVDDLLLTVIEPVNYVQSGLLQFSITKEKV
jgi:hypothetical protein